MNNPFTSKRFNDIWVKHFNGSRPYESLECIRHVSFVKNKFPKYFVNVGKNLTKGVYYELNSSATDFKGKTFLIYDVPSYFEVNPTSSGNSLKVKKVFQYKGFLMNLEGLKSSEEYIRSQFSSKNRREFRSNQRRLETCFNIRYTFYNKSIDKATFDVLFKQFHHLLSNRFAEKQTDYHHLESQKWAYYSELVFHMINEKRASLLVIYKDEDPIGVTLNFHADNILFETITVFDPDYFKFSIGKTSIIKLLDWCFENKVTYSDFSKGDFKYKHKWGNLVYDFEYHILYDSKSIKAKFIAFLLERYFLTKLWLRKNHVNEWYRKFRFISKGGKRHNLDEHQPSIEKIAEVPEVSKLQKIDLRSEAHGFLKKYVYSFLFANPQPEANVAIYKLPSEDTYFIQGSKKSQKITF
ncbi:MAG: GNAT family N-acetyltransferase [Bacteroidia bacterium]|nr:GNAT family N-acetyltransferase [Bacteroidia bacterium]NND24936.1 GNAT family N-acetyltransferase [Flavobacteriaceae bacterium]MBT8279506.1 GNAT family N-acetyltransferase [Bacteroidia bacterium]NNK59448.1 GNAT family N-acetyltransferase [Flavobacteriaceae bacterium]NNL32742.1 GNAT family N-acetyltransferase [Flavobacteriaceae bacterium]